MEGTWDKIGERFHFIANRRTSPAARVVLLTAMLSGSMLRLFTIPIRTYFASLITPLEDMDTTLHLGMTT